jgi:hypothetical protein
MVFRRCAIMPNICYLDCLSAQVTALQLSRTFFISSNATSGHDRGLASNQRRALTVSIIGLKL